MRRLIFIVLFLSCCISLHTQNRYFQLKGKVVSADSLSPIPDAHILSEKSYYGTTSDYDGKFSMLIRNNDSLRISSVGFVTKIISVDYDSINTNNFEITMERDTIMLQEIDVFPYLDNHRVEEIIRQIPVEKPFIVNGANENIGSVLYQKPRENPKANIIQNPIQSLYNRFNKKERLKRKMERNRKKLEIEN